MHAGQRVAFNGMLDRHAGHSFVVTGASSFFAVNLFTWRMTRKMQKAMIRKFIILFINNP